MVRVTSSISEREIKHKSVQIVHVIVICYITECSPFRFKHAKLFTFRKFSNSCIISKLKLNFQLASYLDMLSLLILTPILQVNIILHFMAWKLKFREFTNFTEIIRPENGGANFRIKVCLNAKQRLSGLCSSSNLWFYFYPLLQELLWRKNWHVFCLSRILHRNAGPCSYSWFCLFCLWLIFHAY